ncbi:hypothetical protein [Deferrisoma sp.]
MPRVACERPEAFERRLRKVLKKYPKAEKEIDKEILAVIRKPDIGDRIPGFGDLRLHKLRIGLKAYGIGKSGGLRLIYLHVPGVGITLVTIYAKPDYRGEHEVRADIRAALREILADP